MRHKLSGKAVKRPKKPKTAPGRGHPAAGRPKKRIIAPQDTSLGTYERNLIAALTTVKSSERESHRMNMRMNAT